MAIANLSTSSNRYVFSDILKKGSSRSFAKSQKRCWVEEDEGYIQKIIDEIWYKPPEYEDEDAENNK